MKKTNGQRRYRPGSTLNRSLGSEFMALSFSDSVWWLPLGPQSWEIIVRGKREGTTSRLNRS